MDISETHISAAKPSSSTQEMTSKLPRYTYYLSNYEYLEPSLNPNCSVDGDKSHGTSPKFGIDSAYDDILSNLDDSQGLSSSLNCTISNLGFFRNSGKDNYPASGPVDDHVITSSAQFSDNGVDTSFLKESPEVEKICSVDADDELVSASVADDGNSFYSDSTNRFDDQNTLQTSLFVDQPLADRRQRWMSKYCSGNVEVFRKNQKELMDEIATNLANEDGLSEFPMKCIFVWGETGSDGKFDPLYIREGDVIVNRYRITAVLGSTPFSVVVKALDGQLNEELCIKISMPEAVNQAIDEINMLKALNSPKNGERAAIVEIKDYFYFRGCIFTILELLGANLYEATRDLYNTQVLHETPFAAKDVEQFVNRDRQGWTLRALSYIARDVLVSLKFLHGIGIINCDLKPENIVLNKGSTSPFVKLVDFGSSCYMQERLSDYVQSRSYRAPEVIMGLPYDTQIDMWSLGCVLCELYIKRILFPSDNNSTLMASMISLLGVPPVYLLEHKMNSAYMVLPTGNVADLSVNTELLKGRQKTMAPDYQSSMRCNMSVSSSSVGSIITSHRGLKKDGNITADCDSLMDTRSDFPEDDNSFVTPTKYSITQDGMMARRDHNSHLKHSDSGIKLGLCDSRTNTKCVRIIEPTRCSIEEMLGTSESAELSTFGDFIKGLLQYDPLERLTAESALNHKFILDYCNTD
ncbi:protein kinase domain containing protein [Babesia bovis T2Bo]|uniref:Protein kinase domain containing protein n=1 Tax=Babesia bovis TaxID=5865 RepID=A7APN7_BABBO|nr:protein kinase domain containing protein [Babesia bovis T2Bo]EDO08521.1 protein kinase domain containing protein [Babesia bovis T2Bo]|eukprot:XP_001612089.1 protein kinase domain containing protein [Babesia bovis T2Bo]